MGWEEAMEEGSTSLCEVNRDPFETCDFEDRVEALPVARRGKLFKCKQVVGDHDQEQVVDGNDQMCRVCNMDGDLICCDACTSTFHAKCVHEQESELPETWICPDCTCFVCRRSLHTKHCAQCERCFHPACCSLLCMEQDLFFCSDDCQWVHHRLSMTTGIVHTLKEALTWSLLRSNCVGEERLAEAGEVLHNRFDPIPDEATGIEYLESMLRSRGCKFRRLDFCGFYTAVLMREGEVVCTALLRVHGVRLAEVPFVATKASAERQGMCRRLFKAVEKMLVQLGVERIVLLSTAESKKMWMRSFEFGPIDRKLMARRGELHLICFKDAVLLQKLLGEGEEEVDDEEEFQRKCRGRGRPPKKHPRGKSGNKKVTTKKARVYAP